MRIGCFIGVSTDAFSLDSHQGRKTNGFARNSRLHVEKRIGKPLLFVIVNSRNARRNPAAGVAIITVEERMRGWLAVIAKEKSVLRQDVGYRELALLFEFYQQFEIVPFDEAAARQFDDLRRQKLRIGSRDLKIAVTALVNHALLLSANRSDFETVPGLRVENWLD